MALRRGPFDLQWGGYVIKGVESIETDIEQDSEDYSTVQGQTYTIDGAIKAQAVLTILQNDIPVLAALLPQYHVPQGGTLSTGETVNDPDGAIDVLAASCDTTMVYGDLEIISCDNPGQVFRLVNTRTRVETVEFDDKLGKVAIRFIGEPEQSVASYQFFTAGSIVS